MMSFLLISWAWPNATLALGMGSMVGRLFLEKAYLRGGGGAQGFALVVNRRPAHKGSLIGGGVAPGAGSPLVLHHRAIVVRRALVQRVDLVKVVFHI